MTGEEVRSVEEIFLSVGFYDCVGMEYLSLWVEGQRQVSVLKQQNTNYIILSQTMEWNADERTGLLGQVITLYRNAMDWRKKSGTESRRPCVSVNN